MAELNGLTSRINFFLAEVEAATQSQTVFSDGGMTKQIKHIALGLVANILA